MGRFRKIRYKLWLKKPECFVCRGIIKDFSECSIEHILPRSKGGLNHQRNLSISHKLCNSFRGNIICPLVWENKKIKVKRFGETSVNQMVKLWLEKYGLTEKDLIKSSEISPSH